MQQSITLTDLRIRCQKIIAELLEIVEIINTNIHRPGVAKLVDTFFYMDASHQIMRINGQLEYCLQIDQDIVEKVDEIRLRIFEQWQRDHMIIATPATLHSFLR